MLPAPQFHGRISGSQPWMMATTDRNMVSGSFGHNTGSVVAILPVGGYLSLCLPDFASRSLPYWWSVTKPADTRHGQPYKALSLGEKALPGNP